MLNHRYILEMAVPHTIKHEYSYMRRAAPVMHTYRWKQVAMSNDLGALKKALEGKKNFRIIDWETNQEVFRTECPVVY